MNVNVYLEDSLGQYLEDFAKESGKSRNAIIREAIKEWIAVHTAHTKWPESILKFNGISDGISFESYRDELLPPKEDIFE